MESLKKTPFSEVDATLEVLGKHGVTSQGLKSLRKNSDLAAKVASLIMTGVRTIFKVTVDYGLSLAEMIQAGQYDWFNDNINDQNFSISGTSQHKMELILVHLNRSATNWEAFELLLLKNGLEPVKIEHLLAFGEAYPEMQREFPIVALGSNCVNISGHSPRPYLVYHDGQRKLDLCFGDFSGPWSARCRFLAIASRK